MKQYNIPEETQHFAVQSGLELISTGDGVDYVGRTMSDGRQIVLTDPDDAGLPSGHLDDPAYIIVFADSEWNADIAIVMRVHTIRDGIRFLSDYQQYDLLVRLMDKFETHSDDYIQLMHDIIQFERKYGIAYSPFTDDFSHQRQSACGAG